METLYFKGFYAFLALNKNLFFFYLYTAMEWPRNIKSLTTDELKAWLRDVNEKQYRADQIQKWLFCQQVRNFDEMVNVPPALREKLAAQFSMLALKEDQHLVSTDGTVKWLFETHDGHHIETVMIPANGRFSVCVSTQIGCAQNCAFCRTAKMGFTRNLEAGEILEEILCVNWYLKDNGILDADGKVAQVTNIIFMGMGEPLNNLEQVHRVCCNEYRSSVMPVNRVWPIEKLLEAVDDYIRRTDNYVTFEFVLIQGITCTPKAAKELIRICAPRRVKVNAIVLNDGDDPTLHAPTRQLAYKKEGK